MVGRGSRFVRDPVRQARLDWRYSTLRTHRSVESRTSERAAACTCLSLSLSLSVLRSFSLFVPLEYPRLFLSHSLSRSSALRLVLPLAVHFYVVIYSSPCRSYPPRDLLRDSSSSFASPSPYPPRDRPSPSPFRPRAPRVSLLRLPATSPISVTYTTDFMPVSLSPAAAEHQVRRGWQEHRASPSLVESAALAATRARRTRHREYHLPNAVDAH